MEIMCVEGITSQGSKDVNEDSMFCDSRLAVVIDGASSLVTAEGIPSARWLVDKFLRYVVGSYEGSWGVREIVRDAIRQLLRDYREEYGEIVDDRAYWPSAAASVVLLRGDTVEYMVFSDSPTILYPKGRGPIVVRDERIVQLDDVVAQFIHKKVLGGMRFPQAYREALPLLIEHRRRLCTPDGYSAISLDESCIDYALYGRMKAEEVSYIIMTTDGFIRIVDTFKHIKSYGELLNASLTNGLAHLMVKLRELESRDTDCRAYPRLSVSDDATALLLKISA